MLINLNLTPHELQTLTEFRQAHAEYQRTTSSTPELELARRYSSLSTLAQILAEAVDNAARKQGV